MITGSHSIIYSRHPDADRAFFRDVLGLKSVDAGQGWLIFGLPPSEVAVHPSDGSTGHEFYLLCRNIERFVYTMKEQGVDCTPAVDRGWGVITHLTLPGGGRLGVYEPRHKRPRSSAGSHTPQRASRPRKNPVKKRRS